MGGGVGSLGASGDRFADEGGVAILDGDSNVLSNSFCNFSGFESVPRVEGGEFGDLFDQIA